MSPPVPKSVALSYAKLTLAVFAVIAFVWVDVMPVLEVLAVIAEVCVEVIPVLEVLAVIAVA